MAIIFKLEYLCYSSYSTWPLTSLSSSFFIIFICIFRRRNCLGKFKCFSLQSPQRSSWVTREKKGTQDLKLVIKPWTNAAPREYQEPFFEHLLRWAIGLFSLYVLFSQWRSYDNTLENCFFQILPYSRAHVRIIYEKTKGQFPLRPSLRKQNM